MTALRTLLFSACASVTLAGAAMAMPAAPAPLARGLDNVEQVAQGCGPGWARDRWGNCRPMGYRPPPPPPPRYGYPPPPRYGYRPPPPRYGYPPPPPPRYGYPPRPRW